MFVINKYTAGMALQYKRTIEHRFNMLIANLQSVFTLFILFYFWKSVYGDRTEINGYTFRQLVTYYFLIRVTYNRVSAFGASHLAKQIKSGEITKLIVKPFDFTNFWIAFNSVSATLWTLGNLISILLLSAFLYKFLVLPSSLFLFTLYILVFFLNGILSQCVNLLIGTVGFWTTEVTHLKLIATQVISLLAGGLIPYSYFPIWVQDVLNLLPFKYLVQFPADIYLGKISNREIIYGFVIMISWIAVLYLSAKWFFDKGIKIYESYN